MYSKIYSTQQHLEREASRVLNLKGPQLAGQWFELQETSPVKTSATMNIIREVQGGAGALRDLPSEGAGCLQLDTGAAGISGMDSYGTSDFRTIRNVRLKWFFATLVRIPNAPSATSRIGMGILDATGSNIGGIFLVGSASATAVRIGVVNSAWANVASVVSSKVASNLVGAAGDYKWLKAYCDGANIYGSVDGEPWTLGCAVTNLPSAKGIWRMIADGGTSDLVNVDGVGFWCQR